MKSIAFIFAALVFMMIGRKIGWGLSKAFLYTAPVVLSFIGMVIWGIGVGWCMSGLIGWLHPNAVVKWIMGFALAAYVAIPNYGLLQESSIPDEAQMRHALITWVPLIAYVVTEFATRSMRS
jgi:hypothetical protein